MRHTLSKLILAVAGAAAVLSASTAMAGTDPLAASGRWTVSTRGAAQTPPMGWNSWNAFRTEVDEDKVMGAAKKLVDAGLAAKAIPMSTSTTAAG